MSKIKNKDKPFVDESFSYQFTKQDLQHYSGIKIKNSQTECYLKRFDENNNTYWAKCMRLHNNRIIEIEIVSEDTLLNRLNADKSNYSLVMKG